MVAGKRESEGAGGGWNEVLSGMKTLLETGAADGELGLTAGSAGARARHLSDGRSKLQP